jgi:hypothetical protein
MLNLCIAGEMIERVVERWMNKDAHDKPIYMGIFLSSSAHRELLHNIPAKHPKIYADHITLWFKNEGNPPNLPFGEEVDFRVTEHAEDDKGQAVIVDLPYPFRARNIPHITISTANGVSPVYSNDLISHGASPLPRKFNLKGKIGWWDGHKARFESPT